MLGNRPLTFFLLSKINLLALMRFLSLIAQASSFLNNSSNNSKCKFMAVARNKMSMIKGAEGGIDNPNICYKMKPDSQEESNKTGDKELISYDYIKVRIFLNLRTTLISFYRNWRVIMKL